MARPPDRFAKELSNEQRHQLKQIWRNDARHRVRCRAHAILLSNDGVPAPQLCKILGFDKHTIYDWLNRWDESGVEGLEDGERPGRTPLLNDEERNLAAELVKKNPRRLDLVIEEIKRRTGKVVSRRTLSRLARSANFIWKRMRRKVARPRDEQAFAQAKVAVEEFAERDRRGEFDLYFLDEVGFSLTPPVPYGWQPIGETIAIPSSKGGSVQTLGFMTLASQLQAYNIEGTIDASAVVALMDHFVSTRKRASLVVLDRAPVHTARMVVERIPSWSEQGVELYFLPAYSPELNLIERLWREIKQKWLPLEAYTSLDRLKHCLNEILADIGTKLKLNFAMATS